MNRRLFLSGSLLMLAVPLAAQAQPTGKVYRIGVLETLPATLNTSNLDAFRQGLHELGYVEGQTFVIETDRPTGGLSGSLAWRRNCVA